MEVVTSTSGDVDLKPAQSYSPQEWERKQALITRLYWGEAKTLHQVRFLLAQQNFLPTESMLKKRIKKWDLDRNKKGADMLYALRIALDREKSGKQTEFLIRGRVLTLDEVKRYFRRKRVRDPEALISRDGLAQPTTEIRYRTPGPVEDVMKQDNGKTAKSVALITPPSPQHQGMTLSNTILGRIEQILRDICFFYQRSPLDYVENESCYCAPEPSRPVSFFHCFMKGNTLLEQGNANQAFLHFNRGFDLVNHIICHQSAYGVAALCAVLALESHVLYQGVLGQLLDFVSGIIAIRNRSSSEIAILQPGVRLLKQIPCEERCEAALRGLHVIRDTSSVSRKPSAIAFLRGVDCTLSLFARRNI